MQICSHSPCHACQIGWAERVKAVVKEVVASDGEFIHFIDEVIVFKPLTKSEIQDIVGLQLRLAAEHLQENEISLKVDPAAVEYIASQGFDPQFGARPLKRVIQRELLNALSREILAGQSHRGDRVKVPMDKGALAYSKTS